MPHLKKGKYRLQDPYSFPSSSIFLLCITSDTHQNHKKPEKQTNNSFRTSEGKALEQLRCLPAQERLEPAGSRQAAASGTFERQRGAGGPGRAGPGARPARAQGGGRGERGMELLCPSSAPRCCSTAQLLGLALGTGPSLGVVQPFQ